TLPQPIEIPATNLAALNDTVAAGGTREDYEGVLLRVHDAAVVNASVGFGEWMVKRGGSSWNDVNCPDTLHIGARGFGLYSYTPVNGSQLSWIEGPFEISFDVLKLEPREDSDFVVAGGTTGIGST